MTNLQTFPALESLEPITMTIDELLNSRWMDYAGLLTIEEAKESGVAESLLEYFEATTMVQQAEAIMDILLACQCVRIARSDIRRFEAARTAQ